MHFGDTDIWLLGTLAVGLLILLFVSYHKQAVRVSVPAIAACGIVVLVHQQTNELEMLWLIPVSEMIGALWLLLILRRRSHDESRQLLAEEERQKDALESQLQQQRLAEEAREKGRAKHAEAR